MNEHPTLKAHGDQFTVDGLHVSPEVFRRYKAAQDRQRVQLRAASPMRAGKDQANTHGLALFDHHDAPGLF